jgi:hypothetical protein
MQRIATEYQKLINKCQGKTPNITFLKWSDVEPLFLVAKEIKGVPSPVFASKFCHFMLPGVYPIVDNEVLGGCKSYQVYWKICKKLWNETKNKDALIKLLSKQIGKGVISGYPWPTKVFELCLIGYRARQVQAFDILQLWTAQLKRHLVIKCFLKFQFMKKI